MNRIRSYPWYLYLTLTTCILLLIAAVLGAIWMTVFPTFVRSLLAVWP